MYLQSADHTQPIQVFYSFTFWVTCSYFVRSEINLKQKFCIHCILFLLTWCDINFKRVSSNWTEIKLKRYIYIKHFFIKLVEIKMKSNGPSTEPFLIPDSIFVNIKIYQLVLLSEHDQVSKNLIIQEIQYIMHKTSIITTMFWSL